MILTNRVDPLDKTEALARCGRVVRVEVAGAYAMHYAPPPQ